MSGERTGLPRLSVREYEQRPGAFYIAVGSTGRWIIDDREQAERIVAVYNAAIPAPPDSEAVLRPILVNLFDPENAGGGHGRWVPEDDAEDFWLADDDGCSLLVSAADGAALINHFLAASGEGEK